MPFFKATFSLTQELGRPRLRDLFTRWQRNFARNRVDLKQHTAKATAYLQAKNPNTVLSERWRAFTWKTFAAELRRKAAWEASGSFQLLRSCRHEKVFYALLPFGFSGKLLAESDGRYDQLIEHLKEQVPAPVKEGSDEDDVLRGVESPEQLVFTHLIAKGCEGAVYGVEIKEQSGEEEEEAREGEVRDDDSFCSLMEEEKEEEKEACSADEKIPHASIQGIDLTVSSAGVTSEDRLAGSGSDTEEGEEDLSFEMLSLPQDVGDEAWRAQDAELSQVLAHATDSSATPAVVGGVVTARRSVTEAEEDSERLGVRRDSERSDLLDPGGGARRGLACKVMYNFDTSSIAWRVERRFATETLPLRLKDSCFGYHPNLCRVRKGFAAPQLLCPGAEGAWGVALPPRLCSDGAGRNMTYFLLMDRYDVTLEEYVHQVSPPSDVVPYLVLQLCQALDYLRRSCVAHRDVKPSNLLLDLSAGPVPRLVLADFGLALDEATLTLPYTSHDLFKAGSPAFMAPEISSAEPGPGSVLDYRRSDVWSGALAACCLVCPRTPSRDDVLQEGPQAVLLTEGCNATVAKCVRLMLCPDPAKRVSARTVCDILSIELWANDTLADITDVIALAHVLLAETMLVTKFGRDLGHSSVHQSPVAMECKRLFLQRLDVRELLYASWKRLE